MLTLIAHYRAEPGCGGQIAAVLARHQLASHAEAGCLRFDVHRSIDDRDRFALIEEYTNEAVFQAHRRTSHFRINIERLVAAGCAPTAATRCAAAGDRLGSGS